MKIEHCAQISRKNQVIAVMFWTINRRIPYSQALRIKRICSKTSEAIKQLKDLKDAFIKRGYQSKILHHHFEKSTGVDRNPVRKQGEAIYPRKLTISTYLQPNITHN